jgi:phosphate-selective porin OprO/OprP
MRSWPAALAAAAVMVGFGAPGRAQSASRADGWPALAVARGSAAEGTPVAVASGRGETPVEGRAGTPVPVAGGLGLSARTAAGDQREEGEKAKAEKKAEKKAGKASEQGLVWKDRPSIRAGDWFRLDLRLKLQGDYQNSVMDLTDYGGTALLRRSRAGVKGELFKRVDFEVTAELQSNTNEFERNTHWRDAYVNAKVVGPVQVQAGRFKIPFSLDELTGAFDLDFLNRSLAAHQIAPGRDVGLMVHGKVLRKKLGYQVGAFKSDGDNAPIPQPPFAAANETSPRARAYAGRLVVEPAPGLFIGGNVMSTDVPEGRNNLRDRSVFRYHTFDTIYVNGPRLRAGGDVEFTRGPASFRGEYLRSQEKRVGQGTGNEQGLNDTLPDFTGAGWYVAGTWALTGEKKAGGIVPKKPLRRGGFGAVEAAVRYEELTFQSADTSEAVSASRRAANPGGNTERVLTLGVNWYLDTWIKVQINGIHEDIQDVAFSPVAPKGAFWSTALRLQFVM